MHWLLFFFVPMIADLVSFSRKKYPPLVLYFACWLRWSLCKNYWTRPRESPVQVPNLCTFRGQRRKWRRKKRWKLWQKRVGNWQKLPSHRNLKMAKQKVIIFGPPMITVLKKKISLDRIIGPLVFKLLSVHVSVCLCSLCRPQFWSHKLVDPHLVR